MRLNVEEDSLKFDGKNYHEWAAATKFTLMSKGLWQLIIDKPFEQKEEESVMKFKERIALIKVFY